MKPYNLFLRLIDPDIIFYTIDKSLSPIGDAIDKCIELIKDTNLTDKEYGEIVADEEAEIIEVLLGSSFARLSENVRYQHLIL